MEYEQDYWDAMHEDEMDVLREQEEEEARVARALFQPPAPAVPPTQPAPPASALDVLNRVLGGKALGAGTLGQKPAPTSSLPASMPLQERELPASLDEASQQEVQHFLPKRTRALHPFDMDEEELEAPAPPEKKSRPDGVTRGLVLNRKPAYDHIEVTGPDGRRVYIRVLPVKKQLRRQKNPARTRGGLLSEPFDDLLAKAERLRLQQGVHQAMLNNNVPLPAAGELPSLPFLGETRMWVDEFAPRRYLDLLSDEDCNKKLLSWLKHWDPVVFHRPVKLPKQDPSNPKGQGPDDFKRQQYPKQGGDISAKVVLLSGPPGSGKTTLAHIVASMCGYNPIEINSSDDRSPNIMTERILNATQMQEIVATDRRPNCVILDEIDGATKPAVEALIEIVTAGDSENNRKKKKGPEGGLKRPIICICNDPYSKVLANLKKIAYLIEFKPIDSRAMVARLETICRRKSIRADGRALSTLCGAADGDMRSCISALQFCTVSSKSFTLADAESASGRKDKVVDLRMAWGAVFRLSKARGRGKETASTFNGVLETLQGRSMDDSGLLLQSCFEHYTLVRGANAFDPDLVKTNYVLDWAMFQDLLEHTVAAEQHFALLPYLPFPALAFHVNFSSKDPPMMRWPRVQFEADAAHHRNEAVLAELLAGLPAIMQRSLSPRVLVLDMIWNLLYIITPRLRPVVLALLSPKERELVQDIVAIMVAYGLTYKQVQEEGRYEYRLDPAIDGLTLLNEFNDSKDVPAAVSYGIRQLIGREVAMEGMRRADGSLPAAAAGAAGVAPLPAAQAPVSMETDVKVEDPAAARAAFLAARIGNPVASSRAPIEERPVVHRDFFGRVVAPPEPANTVAPTTAAAAAISAQPRVWFRYNEGCSNAVRRTVRMRDLL
eukprot:m.101488 g.101488  ORF g.101488 m.101488 type:complete len:891 (-) comp8792_c0_seq1:175-2847(-)